MVPLHTDREEHRQGLKQPDKYAEYRARHPIPPAIKPINGWAVLAIVMVGLGAVLISRPKPVAPAIVAAAPAPVVAAVTPIPTPFATPAPVKIAPLVPRALPVAGPLTTEGQPMLSGQQYYVMMPDGRHLLINYKGWVDHACNLPRQPRGGANNAAYTEAATGHTWIYTLPAGTSNVAQWIDP